MGTDNLVPKIKSKSHDCIAKLAIRLPKSPGLPKYKLLLEGDMSLAFHVVKKGKFDLFKKFKNFFSALQICTPLPTRIKGRFEFSINFNVFTILMSSFLK